MRCHRPRAPADACCGDSRRSGGRRHRHRTLGAIERDHEAGITTQQDLESHFTYTAYYRWFYRCYCLAHGWWRWCDTIFAFRRRPKQNQDENKLTQARLQCKAAPITAVPPQRPLQLAPWLAVRCAALENEEQLQPDNDACLCGVIH